MSVTLADRTLTLHYLGLTVDEAVSFIVEALKDPLKPRWCAPCIVACMVVIEPNTIDCDDADELEALVNRNHHFGSTIIAFLTVKRSLTAIKRLKSRWSKCSCSVVDLTNSVIAMPVHQNISTMMMEPSDRGCSRDGKFNTLEAVVRSFTRFLMKAIRKVKPLRVFKGHRPEIWPVTPKDIIPYGPETTIEALVTWSRFMGSAESFSLIYLVTQICGPLIIPTIVASRSAQDYMVEHGHQICSIFSNAPLNPNGQVDNYALKEFIHELQCIGSFIHILLLIPPLQFRDLHLGIAKRTFDFANRAISTIKSPIFPESHRESLNFWTGGLVKYASILYTTLAKQITTPKAEFHPTIQAALDSMDVPSSPADYACMMMRHARSLQFCFALGCTESAQSSGRAFMRCGGCRIVAYSSKECQKRAWADNRLPHKHICKKMKQVYDIGGDYLQRWTDETKFVQEMKRAGVKDVMLEEIGTWLTIVWSMLQRKGLLPRPPVRDYLSQKESPTYAERTEEHLDAIETTFVSMPKRRKARK